MSLANDLLELQEKCTEAQSTLDQVNGKLQGYEEQLEKFECASIKEAKIKLKHLRTKVEKEEAELNEEIQTLKNEMRQVTNNGDNA